MRHNKQMNAGTVQTWVSPGAFAVPILSAKLSSKSPAGYLLAFIPLLWLQYISFLLSFII